MLSGRRPHHAQWAHQLECDNVCLRKNNNKQIIWLVIGCQHATPNCAFCVCGLAFVWMCVRLLLSVWSIWRVIEFFILHRQIPSSRMKKISFWMNVFVLSRLLFSIFGEVTFRMQRFQRNVRTPLFFSFELSFSFSPSFSLLLSVSLSNSAEIEMIENVDRPIQAECFGTRITNYET